MRALINPDDLDEFSKLYPGATIELDKFKAVPLGKFVDLDVLESLYTHPMPMHSLPFAYDEIRDGKIYRRWWATHLSDL